MRNSCVLAVLQLCLFSYFPSTNLVDRADNCYTSLYFLFLLFFYVSSCSFLLSIFSILFFSTLLSIPCSVFSLCLFILFSNLPYCFLILFSSFPITLFCLLLPYALLLFDLFSLFNFSGIRY